LLSLNNVTSSNRVALIFAAAFTMTAAADGQIVYPYPPYPVGPPDASVHLDVTPQDAEVYVDGYYAGVVDDFDGMWQRLRVWPGQHEITVYRDGYRAIHERAYLARDRTFTIKRQLEKLSPEEVAEPRPIPAPLPAGAQPPESFPRNGRRAPPNAPSPDAPRTASSNSAGSLTLHVEPSDASVLIDGQPWSATERQSTVVIDLSQGRHVIQVRKVGYVGYLTEVEVRAGENTSVDVTLRPRP
jgi:hypothetical protein